VFYTIFVYMNAKTTTPPLKWVSLGILAGFAIFIWVFSLFPGLVERFYANGIYPGISMTLRVLTRYIPFSLGDVLYIWMVIWLIIKVVKIVVLAIRRKLNREWLPYALYRTIRFFLWVYIVFKLLWGLNYNRLGIEHQLGIAKKTYTSAEVAYLTNQLINKVNECRRQMPDTVLPQPVPDSLYREAYRSYQTASYNYDFLNYRNRSVKASLFTPLASYLGFTGYYNPFTGEAQVRTDVPRILIPYISCHEMAHQLGYASESEANFVGYLAASSSPDVYFRYSVYLDLLSYAQGEELFLFSAEGDFKKVDSIARSNRMNMDTLVKKDRRAIREFFAKRRNRISPAVSSLYDQYLKMNQQAKGIQSYDEVVGWLIAYQKKYGKL
jgi:hypothetical protein